MDTMLQRAKPSEVGVSASSVLAFLEQVDQVYGVHGFLVIRHGKVCAEGWWEPYRPAYLHELFSMSKTFTSTAVGLAEAEGLLSLDDEVLRYFPDRLQSEPCENMKKMKIRHLLKMATGHSVEPIFISDQNKSWIEEFLHSYVDREPGSWWCYNTPATYMCAAIVQRVSGQSLTAFLKQRLFDPLGIEEYWWETSVEGVDFGGFGLNARLESIAKLGLLYLQKGVWEGKRILPEAWCEQLANDTIPTLTATHHQAKQGYGYQIWRCSVPHAFRGDGAFGQYSVVLPDQDMILAFNSGEENMLEILERAFETIVPALDQPSTPEEEEQLREACARLTMPLEQGEAHNAVKEALSAKEYLFTDNPLGLRAVTFTWGEQPQMLLKVDGAVSKIPMGYQRWIDGQTAAPKNAGSCDSYLYQDVSSAYCWQGGKLVVQTSFTRTPYNDTYVFHFDEHGVILHYKRNVSFIPKDYTLFGREVSTMQHLG